MLFQKNLGTSFKEKTVWATISETGKIVSNVSTSTMQKTANMQNTSGETRETIWMSRQLAETPNGRMNASILGLMLQIIVFVYRIGPVAIIFIASRVSILMTILGAYHSKNMTIAFSIHRIQLPNMKLLLEKS